MRTPHHRGATGYCTVCGHDMRPEWEKKFRQARVAVLEALDALADREGPMPSNEVGSTAVNTAAKLIEARRFLDEYLDSLDEYLDSR